MYLEMIIKMCGGVRGAIFALLMLIAASVGGVQTIRLHHCQNSANKSALALERANSKYDTMKAQKEAQLTSAMLDITATLTKANTDANVSYQTTLASYRAGTLRLRDHFVCPKSPGAPTSSPASGDGEAPFRLFPEDVTFLVSEAKRADDVADQLRAAQAIITLDRTVQK